MAIPKLAAARTGSAIVYWNVRLSKGHLGGAKVKDLVKRHPPWCRYQEPAFMGMWLQPAHIFPMVQDLSAQRSRHMRLAFGPV